MNLKPILWIPLAGVAALALSGCWDAETPQTSSNAPTGATDFSTLAAKLVTADTCDMTDPIVVNSVDFIFAADQDMAAPVDVNSLTPACST